MVDETVTVVDHWHENCFNGIKDMPELKNPRHEYFCRQYVQDFVGSRAAIRAGFSERTARQIAYELLTRPDINARVEELKAEVFDGLTVTKRIILQRMADIAMADPRKLYDENGNLKPIHTLDDETAVAVNAVEADDRGITTKVKLLPADRMLDKLAQHFNAYEDHQKSGTGEVHVHIEGKDAGL